MLKKLLLTLVVAVGCIFSISAQSGAGTIKGTVLDDNTGETVPFANVQLKKGSDLIIGTTTDFDGKYTLKPIPPGQYDVLVSYVGFSTAKTTGVIVNSDRITDLNFKLVKGVKIDEVVVRGFTKPLFEKDQTTVGTTVTREELQNMAVRTPSDIAKTAGNGTFSRDDGSGDINSRGSRTGNSITFVDGVKIIGSTNLPPSAIEEVSVKSGGLSAQYGDVTGAVTSITTRGAFKEYFGGVDYLTSGFKVSDDKVVGLDKYGYNAIDVSAGGPILTKKDEKGEIVDAPLGFLLTAQYSNIINPRPSAAQLYKVKDDVQDLIERDPLFTDGINPGVFKRAEFLTANDFEKIDFQRNVKSQNIVLNGKIDIKLNDFSGLAVGGTFNRSKANSDVRTFQLYNYDNNPLTTSQDIRAYVRYTQRFENAELEEGQEDNSLVKNAFFSIQADFSRRNVTTEDERHGDDFFKYGYVGKFDAVTEPTFAYNDNNRKGVGLDDGNYYIGEFLTAFNSPIAYNYTPGNVNPILSNYTSSYYQFQDQFPFAYVTREMVEGFGGLVNGSEIPNNVYNLWSAPGTPYDSYSKTERDQYRLTGRGSADIGDHAIMLGFEYEQRVERSYSLAPMDLWQLGRGTVNSHILEIDSNNYSITQSGSYPKVTFERRYAGDANRTAFAYNMRQALGLPTGGTDFVDFDSYDIDLYKIDYFAADQLINPLNGVGLLYRGYDYLGNKQTSNPSLDDFFNEVDDLGFRTRPIAPYQPIYISGYIEDKFAYEDLIFRLGVRLDRFDANQPVLKDSYSFFETQNAGYAKSQGADVPGNIGSNYVVYVSDIDNPEADNIVGYRDPETNVFYNQKGEELNNPSSLEGSGGISPWLKNPGKNTPTVDINSSSFKDYEPQYIFMPRVSFSFPISDEATFFANYDILTQRPTGNIALEPIDIIYVKNHNRVINNPELKPTKTISYELGFKQKLTNSSALTLSSFYREQRDEIQVIKLVGAYPVDYLTYGNQDFGTTKGFIINYDLRRTNNISLRINYTLQFAEGTGSGSLSSLNLVNSGQPNLRTIFPYSFDQRHQITTTFDYRYASGTRYNGPKVNGKNILENAGLNIVFLAGSGTPYTARKFPSNNENIGGASTAQPVIGDVHGSRLPWTLRMDARIDKTFQLKWGDDTEENQKQWKSGKKSSTLNVYVQILNVLNKQNIQNVYAYTGNADDDGYLSSALFQDQIRQKFSEESFRTQYAMKLQNMYNYELPRRIRLGLQLNF
ncbi:MAG: carboxypeptidase-like regulatory domain-containing protein [Flavobacteriales bacterium]|nr:carboxypeptidase-like regulatory domain-containing protein [Flavobacteriales bacterium]